MVTPTIHTFLFWYHIVTIFRKKRFWKLPVFGRCLGTLKKTLEPRSGSSEKLSKYYWDPKRRTSTSDGEKCSYLMPLRTKPLSSTPRTSFSDLCNRQERTPKKPDHETFHDTQTSAESHLSAQRTPYDTYSDVADNEVPKWLATIGMDQHTEAGPSSSTRRSLDCAHVVQIHEQIACRMY